MPPLASADMVVEQDCRLAHAGIDRRFSPSVDPQILLKGLGPLHGPQLMKGEKHE
jgi:hypothetical protein